MTNLQNSTVQKKDFTVAILLWLFLGGCGAHRCYIKGNAWPILWYFPAAVCTFGILLLVDVFLLKGMIEKRHMEDEMKEQYLRNQYSRK